MKEFLLKHKRAIVLSAAALACVAFLAALLITWLMKPAPKAEPVPAGRVYDAGVFGEDVPIHDSTEGEIVIGASDGEDTASIALVSTEASEPVKLIADPEQIWTEGAYAGNHTPVEKAEMTDGSIGVLTIDKLGLSVNVFESTDAMEDMSKGVAHFPSTSAWDGNIGLSAHNINFDGTGGYFEHLHTLAKGDVIQYRSALGERTYLVEAVSTIDQSDWSLLGYRDINQLTLITCISGQPAKRLCVQAVEKTEG